MEIVLFIILTKKPRYKIFTINLQDFDKVLNFSWKSALDTNIDSKTVILSKYHTFFNVFSYQKVDKIPGHKPYNHYISFKKKT